MEPADVVDGFSEQHSTADPVERARLLDSVITDTAEFHGLQVCLVGRQQIEGGPVGTSRLGLHITGAATRLLDSLGVGVSNARRRHRACTG